MDLAQARSDFVVRRYLWAKRKAAEEIEDEFPHFWLFKGGQSWKHYQFMRGLSREDQALFVAAQLRRNHPHAVKALGEINSEREKAVEDRWFERHLGYTEFESDLYIRRKRGEIIRFASKRKLQKAMLSSFEKAFHHLVLSTPESHRHERSLVSMKCGDWLVRTSFYFGRAQSLIEHSHVIVSEDRILHPTTPGVTGPALLLMNALSWIGLGRMTFEYLTDADIDPACDSIVTLCREFFDELPKLLSGIERARVSGP